MGLAGREQWLFSWEQTAVAMLQGIEESKKGDGLDTVEVKKALY